MGFHYFHECHDKNKSDTDPTHVILTSTLNSSTFPAISSNRAITERYTLPHNTQNQSTQTLSQNIFLI